MNISIKKSFLAMLITISCLFNIDVQASDTNKNRGIFAFVGITIAFVGRFIRREKDLVDREKDLVDREKEKDLKHITFPGARNRLSSNKNSFWDKMCGCFSACFSKTKKAQKIIFLEKVSISKNSLEQFFIKMGQGFDQGGQVKKLKVLNQFTPIVMSKWGTSTCPAQAIKNGLLGLRYFNGDRTAQSLMLKQEFFTDLFEGKEVNNLMDDEINHLIQNFSSNLASNEEKSNLHIITSFVQTNRLKDFINSPKFLFNLSEPDYVKSFIINTGGSAIVSDGGDSGKGYSHWVACTVKKENGYVVDVAYMNSAAGGVNKNIINNILKLCSLSKENVLKKITEYNEFNSWFDVVEDSLDLYKNRSQDENILQDDLNTLFKALFSNKCTFFTENGDKLEQKLSLSEISKCVEKLKNSKRLSECDANYLDTKILDTKSLNEKMYLNVLQNMNPHLYLLTLTIKDQFHR